MLLRRYRPIILSLQSWIIIHRQNLIRLAIILFALGASILLAFLTARGSRSGLYGLLLLFILLIFVVISRYPIIGILLVFLGGTFTPFSWQGGFNLSQIGTAGLIAIWLLDMLVIKKKIIVAQSRTMLPVISFIIISIGAFLFGQFRWYSFAENAPMNAQLGGLSIYLLSLGAFLLIAHVITKLRDLEIFTWVFIAIGLFYVVGKFLRMGWIDILYQSGFSRGSLFWTWLAALLTGQIVCNRSLNKRIKFFLTIGLVIFLYVSVIQSQDWKSGWFPSLVSFGTIILFRYWKKLRFLIPVFAILVLYIVTISIGEEGWSWGTRLDAWAIVINIAMASPVIGLGFSNYYWYTPLFPIRGYAVRFNSHSQFVDLFAQTGILGILAFTWLFGEMCLLCFRLNKKIPEGFAKGYLYGAIGGILGTFVAAFLVDWVLPFTYNIGMAGFRASILAWFFMGGVVSLEQMVRRANANPASPSKELLAN